MPKLPTVSARQVIAALRRDGWREVDQTGSHVQMKHPTKPGRVSIPAQRGDVAPGTLRSILRQAGLSVDAFIELL